MWHNPVIFSMNLHCDEFVLCVHWGVGAPNLYVQSEDGKSGIKRLT